MIDPHAFDPHTHATTHGMPGSELTDAHGTHHQHDMGQPHLNQAHLYSAAHPVADMQGHQGIQMNHAISSPMVNPAVVHGSHPSPGVSQVSYNSASFMPMDPVVPMVPEGMAVGHAPIHMPAQPTMAVGQTALPHDVHQRLGTHATFSEGDSGKSPGDMSGVSTNKEVTWVDSKGNSHEGTVTFTYSDGTYKVQGTDGQSYSVAYSQIGKVRSK